MAHLAVNFHNDSAADFNDKYQTNADFRQRYAVWTGLLDDYIVSGMRVLDIGCGSGVFSFYVAAKGCEVVGIDGAKAMIDLCKAKAEQGNNLNVQFFTGYIPVDLPAELGVFDAIICSSVLEYIEEKEETLVQFRQFLKPSGTLILSVPNRTSIHRRLEKILFSLFGIPKYYQHVKNTFSEKGFTQELAQQAFGLKKLTFYANTGKISRFFTYFLPTPFTSNLMVGVFEKK